MKTTRFLLISLLTLALALILSGCGESQARSTAHDRDEHETIAASYKAGHGLQLNEASRAFLGLATADVAPRDFPDAAGVPAIPANAVVRTARGDFVFVTNGDWYLRTPVTLGAAAGDWREVRDGLYEGDTVVTHGAAELWLAEIQAVNGGVGCADGH